MQAKTVRPLAALFAIVLAGLAFSATTTSPAHAQLPGTNGKIAFVRSYDVYVANADGTGATNITNDSDVELWPTWSPDGTKILFNSIAGLEKMNADGSGHVLLSSTGYTGSWSPDGTKIVYSSGSLYAMNADGSNATQLTSTPAGDESPTWSPDGSKIAFVSYRDGTAEVYVMSSDGSNQVRLTNDSASDWQPDWSPDGSKIAFSSNRISSSRFDIYVMNADGSGATPVAAGGQNPSWSPNGAKIVFEGNGIEPMNYNGTGRTTISTTGDQDPSWQRAAAGPVQQGTINGTVYESYSGYLRGATVTLHPLELQTTTSISDGSFSFANIPYGTYTLTVNPGCTPFGCFKTTQVVLSSSKVSVSIYPNLFTATPTSTPAPVGGMTKLADIELRRGADVPLRGIILGVVATCSLAAGTLAFWRRRRRV